MRDKKAWFFLVKVDKNVIKALYGKVSQLYRYMYMRSKGVAVVRALASHQRGPGLNLGVNAIMWVEFVVCSLPNCSEGFFFLLKNPTLPNSNSIWKADMYPQVLMNS